MSVCLCVCVCVCVCVRERENVCACVRANDWSLTFCQPHGVISQTERQAETETVPSKNYLRYSHCQIKGASPI